MVGSLEYQYNVTGNWWGAVFVDSGEVVNDIKRSNFKTGAGVGVRWASPVGPIKFDLAAPVGDNETKKYPVLHRLGGRTLMKWLKYLKWPAIILLVLILLIGGTLGWILGTQSGLHFALNLAPRVVSGLAIGQVEGDLRNLTLKQVKYTMPVLMSAWIRSTWRCA